MKENENKQELVTLTEKQIGACYTTIAKEEATGRKASWKIAEVVNKLVTNNVPTNEIIDNTNYNKATISKLSRTHTFITTANALFDDGVCIAEEIKTRYGVSAVQELLTLTDVQKVNMLLVMNGTDKPMTVKEIREYIKAHFIAIEDKETDNESDNEETTETESNTIEFDKVRFIDYLINQYNINEVDADLMRHNL